MLLLPEGWQRSGDCVSKKDEESGRPSVGVLVVVALSAVAVLAGLRVLHHFGIL
jgi:hypothetical protein